MYLLVFSSNFLETAVHLIYRLEKIITASSNKRNFVVGSILLCIRQLLTIFYELYLNQVSGFFFFPWNGRKYTQWKQKETSKFVFCLVIKYSSTWNRPISQIILEGPEKLRLQIGMINFLHVSSSGV